MGWPCRPASALSWGAARPRASKAGGGAHRASCLPPGWVVNRQEQGSGTGRQGLPHGIFSFYKTKIFPLPGSSWITFLAAPWSPGAAQALPGGRGSRGCPAMTPRLPPFQISASLCHPHQAPSPLGISTDLCASPALGPSQAGGLQTGGLGEVTECPPTAHPCLGAGHSASGTQGPTAPWPISCPHSPPAHATHVSRMGCEASASRASLRLRRPAGRGSTQQPDRGAGEAGGHQDIQGGAEPRNRDNRQEAGCTVWDSNHPKWGVSHRTRQTLREAASRGNMVISH